MRAQNMAAGSAHHTPRGRLLSAFSFTPPWPLSRVQGVNFLGRMQWQKYLATSRTSGWAVDQGLPLGIVCWRIQGDPGSNPDPVTPLVVVVGKSLKLSQPQFLPLFTRDNTTSLKC